MSEKHRRHTESAGARSRTDAPQVVTLTPVDVQARALQCLAGFSQEYAGEQKRERITEEAARLLVASPQFIPAFYDALAQTVEAGTFQVPPSFVTSPRFAELQELHQSANPAQIMVREMQGQIFRHLAQAASERASYLTKNAGTAEAESVFGALFELITPDSQAPKHAQAEYFRHIAPEIMRGYIEGCRDEQTVTRMLGNISVAGLTGGNRHTRVLHRILTHQSIEDIYPLPVRGRQSAYFVMGRFSQNDEVLRQSIHLDYIVSLLDERFDSDPQRSADKRAEIIAQDNPEFQRLMRRLPKDRRFRDLNTFYQKQAEVQLDAPSLTAESSKPLPFPYNLTAKPSRLRTAYVEELSLKLLAEGAIDHPIREIAYPVDGLVRDIAAKQGDPAELVTEILRHEYAVKPGGILDIKHKSKAIHDVLTYLPPTCVDMKPGVYNAASIGVKQEGKDALTDRVQVEVKLGTYIIPLVLNAKSELCFTDGSRVDIEETQYEAWRQAAITQARAGFAAHRDNLLRSLTEHEGVLEVKETIDALLYTFRPHYMEQNQAESLAAEYNKAVHEIEHAERTFGLSPRGDMMKVKGIHKNRRITHASRILFDWGNQATTNIAVTIGQTVIPLRFDARYHLTHRDGSPLAVDPQTKTYWETVLMAHLHDRLLGTTRRTKDEGAPVGGEPKEHGECTQVMTPHRRRLPSGHRPTTEQSKRVARSAWVRLNIADVPDEKLLEAYNRILERDGSIDKPFYTWVVPHDETIARCKQKPVEHDAPNALNAVAELNLPEA